MIAIYITWPKVTSNNLRIYFLTEARTGEMHPGNEGIHSRLPRVFKKHICYAGKMSDLHQ